jgi:hypothetical protein
LVSQDPNTSDSSAPFSPIVFDNAGWKDLIACEVQTKEFRINGGIKPPSDDTGTFFVDVTGVPNQAPRSQVIVETSSAYDPPSLCQ